MTKCSKTNDCRFLKYLDSNNFPHIKNGFKVLYCNNNSESCKRLGEIDPLLDIDDLMPNGLHFPNHVKIREKLASKKNTEVIPMKTMTNKIKEDKHLILIQWDSKYETGIQTIDDQHLKLVKIINLLYSRMKVGRSKSTLETTINQLIDYTITHFKTEESIFNDIDYPHKDEHIQTHNQFIQEMQTIKENYILGKHGISIELLHYLKEWVINHIQSSDQKYAEYYSSDVS